jgi:hypothetical protein
MTKPGKGKQRHVGDGVAAINASRHPQITINFAASSVRIAIPFTLHPLRCYGDAAQMILCNPLKTKKEIKKGGIAPPVN